MEMTSPSWRTRCAFEPGASTPEAGRCTARRAFLPADASETSVGGCDRACTGASWAGGSW
eukprot:4723153-Pleurochrysis_carterae.AAC.1